MAGQRDDLTRIKGLGRGSQKLLNQAGISTYQHLAACSVERIRKAIASGGARYRSFDVSRWAAEAKRLARQTGSSSASQSPRRLRGRRPSKPASQAKRTEGPVQQAIQPQPVPVVFSGMDKRGWVPGTPFLIERVLAHEEADLEYQARREELDEEFARARTAIESLLSVYDKATEPASYQQGDPVEQQICKLIQLRQITAISARYRTKFGHPVSPLRVVICINVALKRALDDLSQDDVLPTEYDGIPIKVVEGTFRTLSGDSGRFLRGSCDPASPIALQEPVVGGVPIAARENRCDFGTLGFAFLAANSLLGLTCHHVVKNQSNTIVQLGTSHSWRELATVAASIKPNQRNGVPPMILTESVDCALIEVNATDQDSSEDVEPITNPPAGFIWTRGLSHGVNASPPDTPVRKIYLATSTITKGNTDGFPLYKFGNGVGELMQGRVGNTAHGPVWINVDDGRYDFKNNFTVHRNDSGRGFVVGGDSGSIVALRALVNGEEAFVAIGVLFAALDDETVGLACSMRNVIRALDLRRKLNDPSLFVEDWFPLPVN